MIVSAVLMASAVACSLPPPRAPEDTRAPDASPLPALASAARAARAAGHAVYRIDAAASRIVVHVGRAGTLAALGHEHAVAGVPTGYVDVDAGVAEVVLALDELRVDAADDRRWLGLDAAPDAAAVAGTRRNMLGPVLDADRHPWLRLRARRVEWSGPLEVTIDLHGQTRQLVVPVLITARDATIGVDGTFAVRQREFGITPLSVLGGALQVADELRVRFALHAVRAVDQPAGAEATALPK